MAEHAAETDTPPTHRGTRKQSNNSRLSSSSMNSLVATPQTPLPVSITVRNLFPPLVSDRYRAEAQEVDDDDDDSGSENINASMKRSDKRASALSSKLSSLMVEDRCTLVSAEVLLRLRLEILVKKSKSSPDLLLYSSEKSHCTAHPRWDHLDEQLLLSNDYLQDEEILDNLYARFVAIRDDDRNHDKTTVAEKEEILLAQISLHPSNLRTLPHDDNNHDSSVKNLTVPDSLPPNAILLHYGDGYTRVVPELYGLLVQKGITTENIVPDLQQRRDEKENDDMERDDEKDKSMFEDAAFDALGTKSEGATANDVKKNNSTDDADAVHLDDQVSTDVGPDTKREDDETMDTSTLTEETDSHDAIDLGRNEQGLSPVQVHLPPITDPLPEFLSDTGTDKRSAGDIDNEIAELKRFLHRERRLLEQEQAKIEEDIEQLKLIMEQLQQLDQESTQVMKSIGLESTSLYRAEFRLEAYRIRLLKQLQMILPIRVISVNIAVNPPQYPQHQYTVASIPLPDDIHSASVSDDQISTSIGFLCYLVSLTSKYLSISPRYKMICRFSRSAIIDDQASAMSNNKPSTVYPLFRERGAVDKDQLDHGFALLVRNIECLLQMRQIEFDFAWNALAKMERLFMHVVDGNIC